jgi:PAS domain-containing protein
LSAIGHISGARQHTFSRTVNHLLVEHGVNLSYRFLLKVAARGENLAGTVTSRWLDMLGIAKWSSPSLAETAGKRSVQAAAVPVRPESAGAQHLAATLLDLVPCPAWLRGPDLAIIYANQSYASAAGTVDMASTLAALA